MTIAEVRGEPTGPAAKGAMLKWWRGVCETCLAYKRLYAWSRSGKSLARLVAGER